MCILHERSVKSHASPIHVYRPPPSANDREKLLWIQNYILDKGLVFIINYYKELKIAKELVVLRTI